MSTKFQAARICAMTTAAIVVGSMLLAATPSRGQGDNAEAVACQNYGITQRLQRAIAVPYDQGGTGRGCPGAVGDRWKSDSAFHFNWCLRATQAQRDAETKARRDFLLACNAKRQGLRWSGDDGVSCGTFSAGGCIWSPSTPGKAECEAFGNQIIGAAEKMRQDLSMLFDPDKDPGFHNSRFYYHFSHWLNFRCEIRTGTAGNRFYTVIGYSGPRQRPKYPGQTTAPSPFQVGPQHQKKIDIYKK